MGLYQRVVFPRVAEWVCSAPLMTPWRRRVCDGLAGTVLEVGFGAGLNLPHYPAAVSRVLAVEPSSGAFARADARRARSHVLVEHVGLDGHRLQLEDASADMALVTFTLCTVSEPLVVLGEIARVLRPGGELHFLEHGLSPRRGVATLQRVLDPLERALADGCHLTRDPEALVRAAGFRLVWMEQGYAPGPKPWTFFSAGVAVVDQ